MHLCCIAASLPSFINHHIHIHPETIINVICSSVHHHSVMIVPSPTAVNYLRTNDAHQSSARHPTSRDALWINQRTIDCDSCIASIRSYIPYCINIYSSMLVLCSSISYYYYITPLLLPRPYCTHVVKSKDITCATLLRFSHKFEKNSLIMGTLISHMNGTDWSNNLW